jgi:ribosomal silencing factor RsfS
MEQKPILKEIPNINNIKLKKIKLKMDLMMLDSILAFIYKDSSVLRTRKSLNNTYKLFNIIDMSIYEKQEDAKARIWVIQKSLESILKEGIVNTDMMKIYCKEQDDSTQLTDSIVDGIDKLKLSYEETKYLIKCIDDRLEYGYTLTLKDTYQEILNKIDDGDFKSYKSVSEDLYDIATSVINLKRNTNSLDSDMTFSLKEDYFENVVTEAVQKLKDRNRVFLTGIRRLNTILSPGYQSKRLYTYLAFPGGGKSQILLKAALDIKKYNADVKPKDPNKTPAVLLITMENDIDETIERMFNMKVSSDDIRNYTPKQVIRKLKEDGEMTLTDKNNIDIIIKYYPNRSIDTNDLYGIIKDLYDAGSEVIALILDYVKRIRPAEKAATEKEELKNITNELKTLAKKLDLAVITAQQLNRTAASVVDAAIQAKKEDVTRLVGKDGVAGAWEIIENSDIVIIINQEVKADTGEVFLTFKLLKRRYRSSEDDEKLKRLDYFNHPYEEGNTIKLIDDVDLPKSVSLYSLATQFVSLEETKRGKKNAMERPTKDPLYSNNNPTMEFDTFDITVKNN